MPRLSDTLKIAAYVIAICGGILNPVSFDTGRMGQGIVYVLIRKKRKRFVVEKEELMEEGKR